jgi:hypothetical protein
VRASSSACALKAADGRRRWWTRTVAPDPRWTLWTVPLADFADGEVDLELTTRALHGDQPQATPTGAAAFGEAATTG